MKTADGWWTLDDDGGGDDDDDDDDQLIFNHCPEQNCKSFIILNHF